MTAPTPAAAPEAPATAPPPPQPTPPAPAAPSPADMPAQQPATPDTPADPGPSDGQDVAGEIAKLRKEAAGYRTRLREQEQAAQQAQQAAQAYETDLTQLRETLAALNAVLNPDAEAEPPDPAKLAEQLAQSKAQAEQDVAQRDAEIRTLTVRAALPAVLARAQADPTLTEAVLTASGALGKLDPTADTFTADLESAVNAAVEANPRLKIAPVAVRSGAEIPGRPGGSDQLTLDQVRQMSPEQIDDARRAGRLRTLLAGG